MGSSTSGQLQLLRSVPSGMTQSQAPLVGGTFHNSLRRLLNAVTVGERGTLAADQVWNGAGH